jgi:hypothetical protein
MPFVQLKKSQIYITKVNRIINLLFKPNLSFYGEHIMNNIEIRRARNESIINTLKASGGIVYDERRKTTVRLTHAALFGNEGEYEAVVGLVDGEAVTMCTLDFQNNELHWARGAVGNKLNAENLPMEERVRTYRDWDDNTLWGVTRIW